MASVTCPGCNAYVTDAYSLCNRCGHNLESETPTPDEQARRQLLAETSSAMDYLDAARSLTDEDRLSLRERYLARQAEERGRLAEVRQREAEAERSDSESEAERKAWEAEREARKRQRRKWFEPIVGIAAALLVGFILFGGPFIVTYWVIVVMEKPAYVAGFAQVAALAWLAHDWNKHRGGRS